MRTARPQFAARDISAVRDGSAAEIGEAAASTGRYVPRRADGSLDDALCGAAISPGRQPESDAQP